MPVTDSNDDRDAVFRRIFGRSIGIDRFLLEFWESRALHARRSSYHLSLNFQDILEVVRRHDLRVPNARLYLDGTVVDPERFTREMRYGDEVFEGIVDSNKVESLVSSGCTLVLQSLEQYFPEIAVFCHEMERLFICPVQANAFYTPAYTGGVSPHYDHTDVIVMQCSGKKHWSLWDVVRELPSGRDSYQQEYWDGYAVENHPASFIALDPGDVLYLPRGLLHTTKAGHVPSLHVSVVLHSPTWASLLHDLVEEDRAQLHENCAYRQSMISSKAGLPGLPFADNDDAISGATNIVLEGLTWARVREFAYLNVAQSAFPVKATPLGNVVSSRGLSADRMIRSRCGFRLARSSDGRSIDLPLPGKTLSFPKPMTAALELLSRPNATVGVRYLPGVLSLEAKIALAKTLLIHGLAEILDKDL